MLTKLEEQLLSGEPVELTEASQEVANLRERLESDGVLSDGLHDVSGTVYWNDERDVVVCIPAFDCADRDRAAVIAGLSKARADLSKARADYQRCRAESDCAYSVYCVALYKYYDKGCVERF